MEVLALLIFFCQLLLIAIIGFARIIFCTCPSIEWKEWNGNCYLDTGVNRSISDAIRYCGIQHQSQIFTIDSQAEKRGVFSEVFNDSITQTYWTGRILSHPSGRWISIDGTYYDDTVGDIHYIKQNSSGLQAVNPQIQVLTPSGFGVLELLKNSFDIEYHNFVLCEKPAAYLGCFEMTSVTPPNPDRFPVYSLFGCVEYCRGLDFQNAAFSRDSCSCLVNYTDENVVNETRCWSDICKSSQNDISLPCPDSSSIVQLFNIERFPMVTSDCKAMWLNGAKLFATYNLFLPDEYNNITADVTCYYPHSNHSRRVAPLILSYEYGYDTIGSSGYLGFMDGWIFDSSDITPWILLAFPSPIIIVGFVNDVPYQNLTVPGWATVVSVEYQPQNGSWMQVTRDNGSSSYPLQLIREATELPYFLSFKPFTTEIVKVTLHRWSLSPAIALSIIGYPFGAYQIDSDECLNEWQCVLPKSDHVGCYLDTRNYGSFQERTALIPVTVSDPLNSTVCSKECRNLQASHSGLSKYGSALWPPGTVVFNERTHSSVLKPLYTPKGGVVVFHTVCLQFIMFPKLLVEPDGKVLFAHYNAADKLIATGLIVYDFDILVTMKLFGDGDDTEVQDFWTDELLKINNWYSICITWDQHAAITSHMVDLATNTTMTGIWSDYQRDNRHVKMTDDGKWLFGEYRSEAGVSSGYFYGAIRMVHFYIRKLSDEEMVGYPDICEAFCWDLQDSWIIDNPGPVHFTPNYPLGLADFLIPSEAFTSNTTQHHSCELSLVRLDSAPQNKTRLPGYCPIEDGYIEIDLQSSKIITAIGIQVEHTAGRDIPYTNFVVEFLNDTQSDEGNFTDLGNGSSVFNEMDTWHIYLEKLHIASAVRVHVSIEDNTPTTDPIPLKFEMYGHPNVEDLTATFQQDKCYCMLSPGPYGTPTYTDKCEEFCDGTEVCSTLATYQLHTNWDIPVSALNETSTTTSSTSSTTSTTSTISTTSTTTLSTAYSTTTLTDTVSTESIPSTAAIYTTPTQQAFASLGSKSPKKANASTQSTSGPRLLSDGVSNVSLNSSQKSTPKTINLPAPTKMPDAPGGKGRNIDPGLEENGETANPMTINQQPTDFSPTKKASVVDPVLPTAKNATTDTAVVLTNESIPVEVEITSSKPLGSTSEPIWTTGVQPDIPVDRPKPQIPAKALDSETKVSLSPALTTSAPTSPKDKESITHGANTKLPVKPTKPAAVATVPMTHSIKRITAKPRTIGYTQITTTTPSTQALATIKGIPLTNRPQIYSQQTFRSQTYRTHTDRPQTNMPKDKSSLVTKGNDDAYTAEVFTKQTTQKPKVDSGGTRKDSGADSGKAGKDGGADSPVETERTPIHPKSGNDDNRNSDPKFIPDPGGAGGEDGSYFVSSDGYTQKVRRWLVLCFTVFGLFFLIALLIIILCKKSKKRKKNEAIDFPIEYGYDM